MVERCTNCGRILYPNKILIAYHGYLFCSNGCCREYEYRLKASLEDGLLIQEEKRARLIKEATQKVLDESEEVKGSDLGIDWPRCPFGTMLCDESCALHVDGMCAILILATKQEG